MKKITFLIVLITALILSQLNICYAVQKVKVSDVSIVSMPNKTIYIAGDMFDSTGLTMRITYEDGAQKYLYDYPDRQIKSGDKCVKFYFGDDRSIVVEVPITVKVKTNQKKINRSVIRITPNHVVFLNGYGDGTFKPEKALTKAEAVCMLCKIIPGQVLSSTKTPYADVTSKNWYFSSVGFLYDYGVIDAYEGDLFKGGEPITRAEFAYLISRFKEYSVTAQNIFPDVNRHYWASEEIAAAYYNGWMKGTKDGYFKPEAGLTRAEAAATINRMMGRKIDASTIKNKNVRKFSDVSEKHWAYYDIIEASTQHVYSFQAGEDIEKWV